MHTGRRILRWLWVASVIGSVVMFVAVMGMWVRSYWVADTIGYNWWDEARWGQATVMSARGVIMGEVEFTEFPDSGLSEYRDTRLWIGRDAASDPRLRSRMRITFGHESHAGRVFRNQRLLVEEVGLPHWFLALLCLPLPVIALRRWRKWRRIVREGLCHVCNYDLRVSTDRCPECGTVIARTATIT